ncbi:hypothetical protein MRX96_023771 [Rhipicephalus microplus]
MADGEDDAEVSPGRDDTDGSVAEDGMEKGKTTVNGRSESGKGQRRRRGQPELRPLSEGKKVPEDLTMTVQESLRKYRVERQLFSELQELKRHQIRSGRTHENVLVKRLVDRFRELVLAPGMRDFTGPYTFPQLRAVPLWTTEGPVHVERWQDTTQVQEEGRRR